MHSMSGPGLAKAASVASYRYHGAQVGDLALRDKDRHIAKCRRSIILALVLAWLASSLVIYQGVLFLVPSYGRIWGTIRCTLWAYLVL